jgi:hypothetical protein
MQFTRLSRCLTWTAAAVFAVSCQAQVMQAPGTMPGAKPLPVPTTTPHEGAAKSPSAPTQPGTPPAAAPAAAPGAPATTPAANVPNLPPSLLDKPAKPAHVTLAGGSLSVDAANASLSQILKNIEASTGMTVDGFEKDSRVFGVYGPGDPRDVLSSLLDGAGYNFLMVGSTDAGTPREIVLTARSNAPLTAQPSSPSEPEEEEEPVNNPPVEPSPLPASAPPPSDRPRTPQEMLQELQRLRQQQPQPQGQPQPQPQ